MPISAKIRMPLDIAMTVATLVLMGGNYFFESTAVHEILGVVLLVLWAVHITLNRRFFPFAVQGPLQRIPHFAGGRELRDSFVCDFPDGEWHHAFEPRVRLARD